MNSKEDVWINIIAPIIVTLFCTIAITSVDNLSGTLKFILSIDIIFIVFYYYYSKNTGGGRKYMYTFALIGVILFLFTSATALTEIRNEPEKPIETIPVVSVEKTEETTTGVCYYEWKGTIIPDIGETSNIGETSDTGVCYYDWKGTILGNLTSTYDPGYTYIMVTLYVENDASTPVSIESGYWELEVDGVSYFRDKNTVVAPEYQPPAEIKKGGSIEAQLVYRLKEIPSQAKILYNKHDAPKMERIKHY